MMFESRRLLVQRQVLNSLMILLLPIVLAVA
jgi:hypothetical protein